MSSDNMLPMLNQILDRLSAIEAKIGGGSGGSGSVDGSNTAGVSASVAEFDKYCAEYLDPFVAASSKLGGDAAEAGKVIKEAWTELRGFLQMAASCKEPAPAALPGLLSGLGSKLKESSALVKKNEWEKHTKTCSEGIGCLNWICVKPAPRDFIESFIGGSDYWANGIRKEYRTTNPDQIAFCDTFKKLLQQLMQYVKDFHTTGVSWNAKGVDVSEYSSSSASAPAPVSKSAASTTAAATASSAPAKADLFASLNKEGAVTSGLKKVTKDMQTWRSEFKSDASPAPKAAPVPKTKPVAAATLKGPAKCEYQAASSRWMVEYQASSVQIEIKDKKETVYVFGCVGASINIVGKCKSIVVDSCKKTTITFDTAMASCEVVNCQRMNVFVTNNVPAVAIDKTDGIVVTLPVTSMETEVVASKSSEMNISFPDANGDMVEKPIPEQYIHRIKDGAVTADVSDLYGH